MPRLSEFRLIYHQEQPALVIETRVNLENLTSVIKDSRTKIKKYMEKLGEYPTDVPFVIYHNEDVNDLDIEVCCPTRKPLKGEGEIRYSAIRPGKAVICMLRGDHEERKIIYFQMLKWIEDNGYEYDDETCEYFYFDSREPENPLLFAKVIMKIK